MIDYNQGDPYYYYWTHPCKWVGERNEVLRLGRARFGVKQHRQIQLFKILVTMIHQIWLKYLATLNSISHHFE